MPHEEEEIPFLMYVQENKINGYMHPNMPEGTLYILKLEEEAATFLPLKFRLKIFNKGNLES